MNLLIELQNATFDRIKFLYIYDSKNCNVDVAFYKNKTKKKDPLFQKKFLHELRSERSLLLAQLSIFLKYTLANALGKKSVFHYRK